MSFCLRCQNFTILLFSSPPSFVLGNTPSNNVYFRATIGPRHNPLVQRPSCTDRSIVGDLKSFSLNFKDTTTYLPISYVWGALNDTRSITVNGSTLEHLQSVYAILELVHDRLGYLLPSVYNIRLDPQTPLLRLPTSDKCLDSHIELVRSVRDD